MWTTTGPATTAILPAALLDLPHHVRDAADHPFDAALRGNVIAHEREAQAVALAELRGHANTVVPAEHRLAGADVTQLPAHGPASRRHDHRVHPLLLDLDPASPQRTCVRWLVVE